MFDWDDIKESAKEKVKNIDWDVVKEEAKHFGKEFIRDLPSEVGKSSGVSGAWQMTKSDLAKDLAGEEAENSVIDRAYSKEARKEKARLEREEKHKQKIAEIKNAKLAAKQAEEEARQAEEAARIAEEEALRKQEEEELAKAKRAEKQEKAGKAAAVGVGLAVLGLLAKGIADNNNKKN